MTREEPSIGFSGKNFASGSIGANISPDVLEKMDKLFGEGQSDKPEQTMMQNSAPLVGESSGDADFYEDTREINRILRYLALYIDENGDVPSSMSGAIFDIDENNQRFDTGYGWLWAYASLVKMENMKECKKPIESGALFTEAMLKYLYQRLEDNGMKFPSPDELESFVGKMNERKRNANDSKNANYDKKFLDKPTVVRWLTLFFHSNQAMPNNRAGWIFDIDSKDKLFNAKISWGSLLRFNKGPLEGEVNIASIVGDVFVDFMKENGAIPGKPQTNLAHFLDPYNRSILQHFAFGASAQVNKKCADKKGPADVNSDRVEKPSPDNGSNSPGDLDISDVKRWVAIYEAYLVNDDGTCAGNGSVMDLNQDGFLFETSHTWEEVTRALANGERGLAPHQSYQSVLREICLDHLNGATEKKEMKQSPEVQSQSDLKEAFADAVGAAMATFADTLVKRFNGGNGLKPPEP